MGRLKRSPFELTSITAFDARRGYRRCAPPGVGVSLGGQRQAVVDFWREPNGELVTRFSSRGYVFHMKASLGTGQKVPEEQMEALADWMRDVLVEWIVDGVDDVPEPAV